jgi:general secretion pathway protein K
MKRSYQQSTNNEMGVALVVIMLIVALVTILAVEMSSRLQLNIARTSNVKANNQAYWYALGAEQYAQNSLKTLQTLAGDNINLSQPWAQEFEYPIEGGSIKAVLSDMRACFNLNGVNSEIESEDEPEPGSPEPEPESAPDPRPRGNGPTPSQQAFHNLLENFIQDAFLADTIRDSMIDWLDDDDNPNNFGAEDADYESLPIPYLAANNPMSHPSEIRLINGIDQGVRDGWLKGLKEVICVLPESQLKINVNTIREDNAVVLAALLGDTLDTGLSIINNRPEEGFQSKEDFLGLSEVRALELSQEQSQWFDITTEYFKLETTAKFQGAQFKMATVFELNDSGITIISREFGGAF